MARRPSKRVVKKPPPKRRGPRRPVRQAAPRPGPLASRSSTNLPIQVTSFIGREREIDEIKQALSHTRLLTLTGTGGCGKTRLALRTATDVLAEYPDGVWVAELAPLSDPAVVPKAVATALDLPEQPGRSLTGTLKDALRPKSLLLVLDNCEHLVSACAELAAALLRACPTLRILATSRDPLGIPGEIVWRVPSLSVPDPTRLPPPEHLGQFDAIRLFVDRAATSKPGFAITGRNATAIAQVCNQLEGIPLAIELAAARVKVLTMDQIAARLDDRFRLLTGGGRTSLPRHQTLRGTMDWSYGLLSEQERTVLRRLSVFTGGWIVDAAEAVCSGAGIEATSILDLLTSLADKSLVIAETQGREARYRMLETVRQYGAEKLQGAGEGTEVRQRHRDWCLVLAEQGAADLRGPKQPIWMDRLETEHDNLRAAFAWTMAEAGGRRKGLRLAVALIWFWMRHGDWSEAHEWLEEGLKCGAEVAPSTRAKALAGAAAFAWRVGKDDRATALAEKGLACCREVGDREYGALCLYWLGNVAAQQGDYERAKRSHEEGLSLCSGLENKFVASMALNDLGEVTRYQGDYDQAMLFHEQSLALARSVGDASLTAIVLSNLGMDKLRRSEYPRAVEHYKESLVMCREAGNRWVPVRCLDGLGDIACVKQQFKRAAQLFGAAIQLREVLGLRSSSPDQECHDQYRASARARLGESAFASAWAEGRAMTFEQAIEEALAAAEAQHAPQEATARALGAQADILTFREREVATLIAQGLTNREIASELQVMDRTAETHVQNILNKLKVNSRTQIAVWAIAHGLQPPVLER